MSFEIARQLLTQKIMDTIPVGEVVVIGNDPFDWNSPPEVFHSVKISFQGAGQIGMAADPKTRDYGYLRLRTHIRQGLGAKPATTALDWFRDSLAFKIFVGAGLRITLEALVPEGDPVEVRGWCMHDASLFFRIHPA